MAIWLSGRCGNKLLFKKRMPNRLNIIIGRRKDNCIFLMAMVIMKKRSSSDINGIRIVRGMLI